MPSFHVLPAFATSPQKGQQCHDAAEEDFLPRSSVHWELGTMRTCSLLEMHLKMLIMC